ncbi:putative Histidine kinase [Desulfamplus magnetovallimortis]|uniref:Sensory/regulatory protein RpfC n=1 Tax=Desulfamplus magnetovallimortis TaxID=1246637 RepID=A0A1W1H796_9BACT|nr:response regulator [Desulfamplus magnetovallimortis]SLM28351.1 putative Histidine kinase [Desulfamplus magnetovallimortis]
MEYRPSKKRNRSRHFFSELIIRFLAFFMIILITYSTTQIIVEHILIKRIRQQNTIVANQRAKREIGILIKEKIILLELYFQKTIASPNRHARELLFRQANDEMESLKKLLPILNKGGSFTHKIIVNLNTEDEISEEIRYIKNTPINEDINTEDIKQFKEDGIAYLKNSYNMEYDSIIEIISILPKIDELQSLLSTIRATRYIMEKAHENNEWSQARTKSFENTLQQYLLESDTLLLRCRENSNKIFFDTTSELEKLLASRKSLLNQFDTIRKYFYLAFQVMITIMFLLIFIRITRILKSVTAAEEENRKLLSAIKQSPLSVVITDRDNNIEYVNPAFETITGYSHSEVMGKKSSILNSGYHDAAFYENMWNTLISKEVWHNEVQNRKKNGELFWESATIIPVTDSNSEITGYVAIKEDMTEKINLLKSYEESNAIFQEIFTNLPVGVVLISSEKRIIQLNTEAEKILGYEKDEGTTLLKNKICHNNFCTLDLNDCPIYDHHKNKIVLKERNALKKDGSIAHILKSVIPIKLKGEKVLLEAFMDLSALKKAEMAILEGKNAAESANRAKSEFLANMSHEIRTPMNAIIGFSDILLSGETRPVQKEHLRMISQSAHVLMNLINEILDFSKIEAGKIEIRNAPFSMKNLLNHLSSMFLVSAREKSLTIDVIIEEGTPEYAVGDELRVRQILVNLTANAIKFTKEGGITIKCHYSEPEFLIEVHDTGSGIPKDRIQSIFKAFEQADNSTERNYGGTGLGLSISLSLVRLMGGDIQVESTLNKGSVFMVKLPMAITDTIPDDAQNGEFATKGDSFSKSLICRNSKPIKCLVVEDNPVNIVLAKTRLKSMNIASDSAENGKIALEKMKSNKYDIVLLDMHMPVMNGLETIEAIRKDTRLRTIPVIALTADAIKGHKDKYHQAGCDAYIAKPFTKEALESTIHKLIPDAFRETTFEDPDTQSDKYEQNLNTDEINKSDIPAFINNTNLPENLSILIVDDIEENRKLLATLIQSTLHCHIILAKSGQEAIEIISDTTIDMPSIILLDIMMPLMNGYETAEKIKNVPEAVDIPILFITAMNSAGDKIRAFSSGGVDFITKPFNQHELLARINVHLSLKVITEKLKEQNRLLEDRKAHLQILVDEKTRKIEHMTLCMVSALENANLYNDNDTGLHIRRVALYSALLAEKAGLDSEMAGKIKLYSPLHDVGKVGIPDNILKKPGRYTTEEFELMKQHVAIGGKMLSGDGFDKVAKNIALYHHERWDGNGYLMGLKGENIPIEARIVAVADVYDALTTPRSYKPAFSMEKTADILNAESGTHFDPELIRLFFKNIEEFTKIGKTLKS